jgi:TonB family protein
MQHCRTTYSKALLLSVIFHVAVVGSAIAFAQYGGSLLNRHMRSITVTLLGSDGPGRPGSVPQARKKPDLPAPFPEAPKQELNRAHPDDSELPHGAPPAAGGGEQGEETSAESPLSAAPAGDGRGQAGDISLAQWQLIQSAIEKAKTYPRMARERGVEGVVLVRFWVLPNGDIEKVDVVKSSGSDILDTASVRTVYRAAPMPYVNGWVDVPINYVIK